MIVINL